MIPAYLDPEILLPRMQARPILPFLVRSRDYSVIDGDTFRILAPPAAPDAPREEAFRIRLPNVDAPELRPRTMFDTVLRAGGPGLLAKGPGEVVRDRLRALCRGRAILVEPVIAEGFPALDRHRRLLAHAVVSGSPGRLFDIGGAVSVEWFLLQAGLAQVMPGRPMPPKAPPAFLALVREMGVREARARESTATPGAFADPSGCHPQL